MVNKSEWAALTPDELLTRLLAELQNPLSAIKAWTGVLATESCEEVRFQGLQVIHLRAEQIEQTLTDALQHLKEQESDK